MKKYFFYLLIGMIGLSCTKESDKHLFNTSTEASFTIPAGLDNIQTHYFIIENIPSFYEEKKSISGVTDDDIVKILANTASILPKFGEVNYGLISELSVNLYKDDSPKLEAFYIEYIDVNHFKELKLLSSLTNLKEILSKPSFDLEIRIKFKTFTSVSTQNKIKLNFSAFAQP